MLLLQLLQMYLGLTCGWIMLPQHAHYHRRRGRNGSFLLCSSKESITAPHNIVIIGAGVGGLAVAARLGQTFSRISVLEKNSFPGGRCGSYWTPEGTRHERGASLLLLPRIYHELFQDCGASLEDYFEIKPCIPAYQVIFSDGDRLSLGFRNDPAFEEESKISRDMMDSFEVNGAAKFDRYMEICEAYLDCGLPNFIEQRLDLSSFPSFIREALLSAWPLQPHSELLDTLFLSDKMKALASFQDLYVGLKPYRDPKALAGGILRDVAPAVFGLLAAIELHPNNANGGVYAPVGGFNAVTRGLEALALKQGCSIHYNSTVTSVRERQVTYIQNDGQVKTINADVIIINADLPYSTQTLMDSQEGDADISETEERFDWDDKYDFSSGVIAFHWSLSEELDDLNTHNVFLESRSRSQAEDSWSSIGKQINSTWELDMDGCFSLNFYVHRASKTDPTAAPKGQDSILILVPCPALKRQSSLLRSSKESVIEEYSKVFPHKVIQRVREEIIRRLSVIPSLSNIQNSIVSESVETPADYCNAYNVAAGTPFALSHGLGQLSLTRPGFVHDEGIYFVGASTRPGNGVPLTLTSARLVSELVKKKEQLKTKL